MRMTKTMHRRCDQREAAEHIVVRNHASGIHRKMVYDESCAVDGVRLLEGGARRAFDVLTSLYAASTEKDDNLAWDEAVDKMYDVMSKVPVRKLTVDAETGETHLESHQPTKGEVDFGLKFAELAFAAAVKRQVSRRRPSAV